MSLRTPPLRDVHEANDASFTDFGGWEMPVEFEGIQSEHAAVRESVGRFDVSHMSEIVLTGPDARELMQRLSTNDVRIVDGGPNLVYSMCTDEEGIILDDVMLYHLPEEFDGDWLFVPNAGHDEWLYEWAIEYRDEYDLDVTVENRTDEYAMFAIQGPDASDVVGGATEADVDDLDMLEMLVDEIAGVECLVSASGYTGESGYEILCDATEAEAVWSALECTDCGLGARDTLRLEMGFLLSGNEFDYEDEPRNPYETGWGRYVVKLDTPFVGHDALERVFEEGVDERLVGIRMIDRGIPRNGYSVQTRAGKDIGHVTSGTMSPTLNEGIALAYVDESYADPDTTVRVEIRGEPKKATITTTPFIEQ
ncbi:glycine cleavage system aminomethyltransferase GcvT [Haloarculaceae archaeon H-GB2-1]|nr:glycine cleavage system aminomethyltransferase GcvT [Haloarculaceae archaeon H-GB1-1]MEA5407391.1 glycine cleavage system aminomethyltransferase GcvT [Haloarculaceae archaeon H-GB2-1]